MTASPWPKKQSPGPVGPGDLCGIGVGSWLHVLLVELERLFVALLSQLEPDQEAGQNEKRDDDERGQHNHQESRQYLPDSHGPSSLPARCRSRGAGSRLGLRLVASEVRGLGDHRLDLVACECRSEARRVG